MVVVVPAHNERDRLPDCLTSIAAAGREVAVPVTVMVVLDGCTDGTEDVIPSGVHTINIAAKNVGAARAAGFRKAAPTADSGTWAGDDPCRHGGAAYLAAARISTTTLRWPKAWWGR